MRLLEEEGRIVRRHGVGTFVARPQPVIEGGLEVLESIERMAERRGLTTEMQDLQVSERIAGEAECGQLELPGASQVTAVTRAIVANGERVAYLTDLVPEDFLRAAELTQGFHGSVLDLFLERGWPELSHSWTELAAEHADSELARRLHVQRGAPLLKLEARLYSQDSRVVDYSISYFLPGHFRFHVVRRVG
jgi:GntR family transcriptional regulator